MAYFLFFHNILVKKGCMSMSAYKRFVSYIFSYENGVKKENVGYARIENYNEQCRINIYMKLHNKREQKASVYLFYRDEGKMHGIFMKEMTMKDGFGNCKITTESENIGGFNCNFENIGGIIIYVTANRFWGTEWDDKPIYGFEPAKQSKESEKSTINEKPVLETEREIEPILETEQKVGIVEEFQEEVVSEKEHKPEEQLLKAAVLEGKSEEYWNEECREEEKRYFEESSEREQPKNDCFEPYTKIYPFYEQNRECIGISPKDLATISPILEQWQNNDFLLHGYGRFRHIILLRKKGEKEEYFIGVPGMYRPSEEKLATTYGFSMFVPMKKQKAEYGDFGYFCTMVEME